MKARTLSIPLLIATLSIAATTWLQAAPSLPITEPPVISTYPDGPRTDPGSTNGQWFIANGVEEFRPLEFYDNLQDYGGGHHQHSAIEGHIQNVQLGGAGQPGTDPIVKFQVLASIRNDTYSSIGQESASSNSHGESRPAGTPRYSGALLDTKLTVEFAIADTNNLPQNWTGPYRHPGQTSWIIAENEDQLAWYCWNELDPPQGDEPGNYYVPTWDFGDIQIDQSATRTLTFIVDPPMYPSDPRYYGIIEAEIEGADIFLNRTSSLKISTWLDGIGYDFGWPPYPDEVLRSSDVSVFHNAAPPYDPTHKMHWPQLPDPNGWDVRACLGEQDGKQKVLADDFRCTSSGPITKITFWGSYRWDEYNWDAYFQGITNIHLSVHKDIPDPDGQGPEYSKPVVPAEWKKNLDPYALPAGWMVDIIPEALSSQGWYDPNTGEYEENNHSQYFRYEITIPPDEAFIQTAGDIYWLDVSVQMEDPFFMWGWKTSTNHWNDDAVWADLPLNDPAQWNELIDPIEEFSLDLAFVIDGDEEVPEESHDFGDAPDTAAGAGPGNYETLAADNGAYHLILPQAPYFDDGTQTDPPDGEPDGQPDINAKGDDTNGLSPDDEDGISIPVLTAGQAGTVTITVDDGTGGSGTMGGYVDAWIDYNADGIWGPAEKIVNGWLPQGPNPIVINVPSGATPGQTFARFRINSQAAGLLPTGTWPTGTVPDGEVEDYELTIEPQQDWGDAPDPTYPTLAASGGARHGIAGGGNALRLGLLIDADVDGQPTAVADGDDVLDGNDDEDGIVFTSPIVPGIWAAVDVTAFAGGTAGYAYLQGWIDFNADGDWQDAGEQIFTDQIITLAAAPTITSLSYPVPISATNAPTFARFRLSTATGLGTGGPAADGEVEDYPVQIEDLDVDWGDLPEPGYPVTAANSGAHHIITPILFLGGLADGETNGQPTINADGDDLNGLPDEDGVILKSVIMPGGYASVDVIAAQPGMLDAWLDFNVDGSFTQSGDQIFGGLVLPQGTNALLFPVPTTASGGGPAHARFRFTSGPGAYPGGIALPTGLAMDGEVEDYHWIISRIGSGTDWGDAPDPNYPTRSASGGAYHTLSAGVMLGAGIDAESDGQPNSGATGDDGSGIDDEDGVTFTSKIVAGTNATINVVAGVSGGQLDAWIDFDNDGTWGSSEHLFGAPLALAPGLNAGITTLKIPSPPALKPGPAFARFRISTAGGLLPFGAAADGEVEDYAVDLYQPAPTNSIVITNQSFNASFTVTTNEWTVESGIIYQMESSTNLVTGPWTPAGSTVLGPVNLQTDNMSAETSKFYRVTAPWTP
ncbi:GEVED domain-containing protein [Pontiella sp.]|uniref:DUF7901 domain-containing protein n=1 Tax=Pontiella sp. TaxID=2837462 RepID=UPI00356608C8